MNTSLLRQVFIFCSVVLTGAAVHAQVGIGTTDPDPNSVLDVYSHPTINAGGLLVPRISLSALSSPAPLTAHVAGMVVYNISGSPEPGFYYNDGQKWVRLANQNDPKTAWELEGNDEVTSNNFLGTINDQPLRIRTNDTDRFDFTTGGELRAYGNGSAESPVYSWAAANRNNSGMYSPANNQLGFSTGGSARLLIANSYLRSYQNHRFADGTAGSPSIAFNSNTGTGFWRPGANILATSTSGTERMRIDANGQVLVNTQTTALNSAAFESQIRGNFTTGILGIGAGGTTAIRAENQGQNGDALWALNTSVNGSGDAFGIWSTSNQTGGSTIVSGLRSNGFFSNSAISAISQVTGSSSISYGIIAETYSTNAQSTPVKGQTSRSPTGGIFLNSWENNNAVGGTGQYIGGGSVDAVGLVGISNASGWLFDYGYGVIGEGEYYGVFANGEIGGSGTKTFLIDHPLDPENKLLRHYSMESSEVLNLYRGSATFDNEGKATVEMPEYFEAINVNYTYQLTAIGAAMPNLYIAQEIKNNQFEIAGGVPGKKVNWVVYGERNDPYLQKYPEKRKVVLNKKEHERGKYYRPELFGQPEEMGVFNKYKRSMTEMKHKKEDGGIVQIQNFHENSNSSLNSDSIKTRELPENTFQKPTEKSEVKPAESKIQNQDIPIK